MISKNEIQNFFADDKINLDDYLVEEYLIETFIDPELAVAGFAMEQSTAQWKRSNVEEDFRTRYGAKVLSYEVINTKDKSLYDLPLLKNHKKFYECTVKIANPHINFGAKFPNILTAAAGEGAFYSNGISLVKLVDLHFPKSLLLKFSGPRFGVNGFRDLLQVYDRPLFFGVVKPNVGLPPNEFAKLAYEAWVGGLDVAKDDEMLADVSYSPVVERTMLCNNLKKKAEDETGLKKMFLANITDEVDKLIELHDAVVSAGADSVMVNVFTIGLSAVRYIVKHATVPVVAHFDFIAPFTRLPAFGLSTKLVTKLQRLSGCDAIIMPGFGERMMTSNDEVKENVNECLKDWNNIKQSLPIPGGSDSAETLRPTFEKLGTIDFACIPGRGVFGHKKGPRAGAKSLHDAWYK